MWKHLFVLALILAAGESGVFKMPYDCADDPNSEPGCGLNTNRLCSDVGKSWSKQVIKIKCPVNGCDCKKGYYYSRASNSCVPPDECFSADEPLNHPEKEPPKSSVDYVKFEK